MTVNIKPVKGTRDYLPWEMRIRDAIQTIILRSYENNGFSKIQTPMLEDISLLDKSEGGENLNMIFRILKRGRKLDFALDGMSEKDLADMGLRFDLTLPLSRYYANNRARLRTPFKVIQIGQVFRAERPQKGRLREFYQCDIDIIGDSTNNAEIELIHTTAKTLIKLGFENFTVRINDRRILFDLIEGAGFSKDDVISVCISFDKLDKIGIEGVWSELIEKGLPGDCVKKFMEDIIDSEGNDLDQMKRYCRNSNAINNLQAVIGSVRRLSKGKYGIEYDRSLARGMGYYTGIIFEIEDKRFSGSIAGGGRYDKMIGSLTGEDVPAVGFSIGFERISEILLSAQDFKLDVGGRRMALLYDQSESFADVVEKADCLRNTGYDVTTIVKTKKVGKQFAALQREGFEAALVYGEKEIRSLLLSQ